VAAQRRCAARLYHPEFRDKFLVPNYLGSIAGSPDEFADYIRAEAVKWSRVIKDANIRVD
jgi:tripartite-type tricarboxylate transporter receptor subunit TctC